MFEGFLAHQRFLCLRQQHSGQRHYVFGVSVRAWTLSANISVIDGDIDKR